MLETTQKVIKGYVLTDLIGVGGFGAVYRAHQPIVDREVAIKAILPEYANHPDFIRRFETEAQIVARLEHPHIVPLYDYWREPDGAYLVMRLLRGGNLHEKLAIDGAWTLAQAGRFLDQIGTALAVAHRKGIVHQDMKPGNILLDEDLNSYLADFGIAKNLLDYQDVLRKNPRVGTPLFMAPEQFSKESIISPQTDIYSLGIVLYTVLTGRVPFANTKTTEIIRSHLSTPLPPVQFVRPDLPHEINQVLKQATAKEPEARYDNVLMMASDFRQCIVGLDNLPLPETGSALEADLPLDTATVILTVARPEIQNPYKGLQAFQEADASDFFGREPLTERLLKTFQKPGLASRFLAVVGPSGSGKSSVVLAGVLPLLRQGYVSGSARWFVVKMQPGSDPYANLESTLNTIALNRQEDLQTQLRTDENGLTQVIDRILPDNHSDLLIVIDQFEELFTLVQHEADRAHFLKLLYNAVHAPESRLHVIITLRADFYDRPLLYPQFGDMIREHTEVVLPLSQKELGQAITMPAERSGLVVEPGLVNALVRDVAQQPGTLPLLQYSLTDLFERRKNGTLTLASYEAAGGISGTLSRKADELYTQLPAEQQRLARQMFLRMVAIRESSDATRRRVKWSELLSLVSEANRPDVRAILDLYGRNRLFTFDHDAETREPTVEVAHEALIRGWSRLQTWLEENRADLVTQRRLAAAITEWEQAGHDSSYLATGSRLAQFEAWQQSTSLTLNAIETRYLAESIARRQRETRQRRLFIAALVLAAVISLGLAKVAFDQQAATARQAEISRSRELAATALTSLDRLDRSVLLSLEALNSTVTFEARNSLLTGLQTAPDLHAFLHGHTDGVRAVVFSPDGALIASGGRDGTVQLWDVGTTAPVDDPAALHDEWVNSVAFSPDGEWIACAGSDGLIHLWAVGAPEASLELVDHSEEVWHVAFSPDGSQLVSVGVDGARLWDLTTDAETPAARLLEGHTDTVYAAAFSPNGALLATAGADRTIRLWDANSWEPVGEPLEAHSNWVLDIAFSPNGRLLASTGVDSSIVLWDLTTLEALGQIRSAHTNWIRSVSFSPDGTQLLTASTDGTLRLWDVSSGEVITTLTGHQDAVWDAAFSPDGRTIASAGQEGAVILWQPGTSTHLARRLAAAPVGSSLIFSPDRRWLAEAAGQILGAASDPVIRLWDLDNPDEEPLMLAGHGEVVTATAFSADGQRLASTSIDRTIRLWDLEGEPAESMVLRAHTSGVFAAAFSPDGRLVASGDDTGLIILWDAQTGEIVGDPLTEHLDQITALRFTLDGSRLISADRSGEIRIWRVDSGERLHLITHNTAVNMLALNAQGTLLAAGDRENVVRVWDLNTGRAVLPPLAGHAHWVLSAAFSPDGTTLATGSRDGSIILWDVQTGRVLGSPLVGADEGWVMTLAYEEDGETLLAASTTGVTRWNAGLTTWQAEACTLAGRSLTEEEWARYLPDLPYNTTCPVSADTD
ncbi:MAG: protein kinase [Anaerolineae bacterium]|nr:protein kinase [Anaerolineae bacterium]